MWLTNLVKRCFAILSYQADVGMIPIPEREEDEECPPEPLQDSHKPDLFSIHDYPWHHVFEFKPDAPDLMDKKYPKDMAYAMGLTYREIYRPIRSTEFDYLVSPKEWDDCFTSWEEVLLIARSVIAMQAELVAERLHSISIFGHSNPGSQMEIGCRNASLHIQAFLPDACISVSANAYRLIESLKLKSAALKDSDEEGFIYGTFGYITITLEEALLARTAIENKGI